MGYSERWCALCGVSFNMSRQRLPYERPSAGFQCTGDGTRVGTCYEDLEEPREVQPDFPGWEGQCECDRKFSLPREVAVEEEEETEEGEHEDPDYVYQSSDGSEPYEYGSDDDLVEDSDDGDEITEKEDREDSSWFQYLAEKKIVQETVRCTRKPEQEAFRGYGYDGKSITAEEMRGCNTGQCLVRKGHECLEGTPWQPEPHDQDFERETQYCLSGLSDRLPSYDCGSWPTFSPRRHGGCDIKADTNPHPVSPEPCMPFHPTCFDIFTRQSRARYGYVDINGLMDWFHCKSRSRPFRYQHDDPDVDRSSRQWWEHHTGLEYLGANPLFIPRLPSILRSVMDHSSSFRPDAGALNLADEDLACRSDSHDSFHSLPNELRWQVLSYLNSGDIANLRLATRAFRQLPILLWRHLLRREMPWLWEVWSNETPYIWTCVTGDEILKEERKVEAIEEGIALHREFSIGVNMPEILPQWEADMRAKYLDCRPDLIQKGYEDALQTLVTGLPPFNTNWYLLYTELTRNWENLKGLKNRRRIWKAVEGIVRWIDDHQDGNVVLGNGR